MSSGQDGELLHVRQEKRSENIPAMVLTKRAGDKGQPVKLIERVSVGSVAGTQVSYLLLQPQNVQQIGSAEIPSLKFVK